MIYDIPEIVLEVFGYTAAVGCELLRPVGARVTSPLWNSLTLNYFCKKNVYPILETKQKYCVIQLQYRLNHVTYGGKFDRRFWLLFVAKKVIIIH